MPGYSSIIDEISCSSLVMAYLEPWGGSRSTLTAFACNGRNAYATMVSQGPIETLSLQAISTLIETTITGRYIRAKVWVLAAGGGVP